MLGKLQTEPDYIEEHFGILTDDDLYLDCVLVRPRHTPDEGLKLVRAWVPRFPLTKTSTIGCARQEVQAYGPEGSMAHLVFDLRGTGESEGDDQNFEIDLQSVKAWALERFGEHVNFGFLGAPTLANGQVTVLPIRPGVVMECYYYPTNQLNRPTILYLASYGNFDRFDDARCAYLASSGYEVYGLDPMRYLLHASMEKLLVPQQIQQDLEEICALLGADPYVVAMPISAGLGLLWAGVSEKVRGVVAIGRAQPAFQPQHIFDHTHPHTFMLTRYTGRIAPRSVVLVWQEGHPLGGEKQEMAQLFKSTAEPRRAERTADISPQFLLNMLAWMEQNKG
jgi:hypothetical protein